MTFEGRTTATPDTTPEPDAFKLVSAKIARPESLSVKKVGDQTLTTGQAAMKTLKGATTPPTAHRPFSSRRTVARAIYRDSIWNFKKRVIVLTKFRIKSEVLPIYFR